MGKLFCNATFVPLTDEDARADALLVVDEQGEIGRAHV